MKSPIILLIGAFLLTVVPGFGQDVRTKSAANLSLGIADESLIDQLMFVVPGVGSNARDVLERQSLKPYMMPVRQVGFRGNELTYMLASCLEYYVNLGENYKINLSPDYITLMLRGGGQKINVAETMKFLAQEGTVNAAIVPYDAAELTGAVYATPKLRLVNYLHIFRDITFDRQRVFETRKALTRGNPVLVEIKGDESIRAVLGARYFAPSGRGEQLYPFLVVGFDENEEAFELMGAWGNQWGSGGYIWMKYDDFGKTALNGYVMIPQEKY